MTFPAEGDEVIYQAYVDYQEMCGPDGEDRYPHYWSYIQDQVENYRHLIREEDTPENQQFLNRLEAEVLRHIQLEHGQAEDAKRIIGAMRPQAYDPDDPVDGKEQGQYVNVRLWVAQSIQDPVSYVRERVLRDSETAYPDVSVLECWLEDPE